MTGALVIGFVVWLPVLFLVAFVRGRWFGGVEALSAAGVVAALLVPGLLNAGPGSTGNLLVAWAVALAPLLALSGSLAQFLLHSALSHRMRSQFYDRLTCALILAGCFVVGMLIHLVLS